MTVATSAATIQMVQRLILATISDQRDSVAGPPSSLGLSWAIAHALDEHGLLSGEAS